MVEAAISSYLPLYRKYRPQKFSDLVGQEAVTKILSSAIELNKVSHAYLFTGSRGTGKTSSARIFAKSLNCEKGPTPSPCGVCASCTDITAGRAVDVIEIDAASNRSVEHARNILEKVQFAPVAGKYKVYIIDEVHMLSKEAFNTLLKTLEEPPKNLVFILATTETHKVLETIVSRCQRFDFKRIKTELIVGLLQEISKIENININDEALFIIARKAQGGLRDALSLLDQVSILSLTGKQITEEDVLKMLGSLSEETLYEITQALAEKNIQSLLKFLDYLYEKGNEPVQIIRELIGYFRNLMLVKTSDNYSEIKELVLSGEEFYSKLKTQSAIFETIEITQIIEKLAECERALKNSSQQGLWIETGLISICHRHDIQVIKNLEERIEKLESLILSGNIPTQRVNTTYEKPITSFTAPIVKEIELPEKTKEPAITTEVKAPVIQTTPKIEPARQEEPKPILIKEEKPQETQSAQSVSSITSVSKEDLIANWKLLLKNITSPPTMSLFMQLSTPVEITADRIIVTFKDETWVKKIQDEGKAEMLEKAAIALFGKAPRLIIRTPMPEDKANIKADKISISSQPVTEVQKPKPAPQQAAPAVETHTYDQITSDIVEERTEKIVKRSDDVKNVSSSSDDLTDDDLEEIQTTAPQIVRTNLPETAVHLLNVFNGKLID
ncbi:MAG: DNA polymerase III subunit gamma/tau [bacterium]